MFLAINYYKFMISRMEYRIKSCY